MKKTLNLSVALLAFAMIFGTSCKKYEEGPALSLRSKKARVANTWTVNKMVSEDGDEDIWTEEEKENYTIEYTKDGNYSFEYSYEAGGSTITVDDEGTWEFSDNKEKIITTDGNGDKTESTIILLKNDEMGVKDEDGNKTYLEAK